VTLQFLLERALDMSGQYL